jgi:hypothetical protein
VECRNPNSKQINDFIKALVYDSEEKSQIEEKKAIGEISNELKKL